MHLKMEVGGLSGHWLGKFVQETIPEILKYFYSPNQFAKRQQYYSHRSKIEDVKNSL